MYKSFNFWDAVVEPLVAFLALVHWVHFTLFIGWTKDNVQNDQKLKSILAKNNTEELVQIYRQILTENLTTTFYKGLWFQAQTIRKFAPAIILLAVIIYFYQKYKYIVSSNYLFLQKI